MAFPDGLRGWFPHLARPLWLALAAMAATPASALELRVTADDTGAPVPHAHVVVDRQALQADGHGRLTLPTPAIAATGLTVGARAPGFRATQRVLRQAPERPVDLALPRFTPKALYLTARGLGHSGLRNDALALLDRTELNALVIDIRSDNGLTPYRSAALVSAGLSHPRPTVSDLPRVLDDLRARGHYLIGRIVVFKDDAQARAHPDRAVRKANGQVWTDREGLQWVDPSRPESGELALALAVEAAQMGFDEVQFDYVRFPDAKGLRFAAGGTSDARVAAIAGFLDRARARLAPHNVFVSADIFGYVCWNTGDTDIGQQLEALAGRVDYLSPMLYPSGFTWGIPGHRQPVAAPGDIVDHSLREALRRTGQPGVRWRPWLQAFRDYAFDRRPFGAAEIRAQIDATERQGTHGWLLWNARNRYSDAGLKTEPSTPAGSRP